MLFNLLLCTLVWVLFLRKNGNCDTSNSKKHFHFHCRRFTWLYILGEQQHLYFYTLSIDCFLTGGLGLAQIHTGNSLNEIHVFYPLDFVMCNKTDLVWIRIITPLLTSWVTLSKFLNLPESSLLICKMRTDHFLHQIEVSLRWYM